MIRSNRKSVAICLGSWVGAASEVGRGTETVLLERRILIAPTIRRGGDGDGHAPKRARDLRSH